MYYYIFDPPTGAKEYERTAQIKELLGSLGIAGEMTQPQPGKTPEDLVHTAIAKRYSTIIAVGGMQLINQVARAAEPYEVVFGIIPTMDHPDITRLIGTSEWRPAAEQLKRRRWQAVRMGIINSSICFLTPAHISLDSNVPFTVSTPTLELKGTGGDITIAPEQSESGEAAFHIAIKAPERRQSAVFLANILRRKADVPRDSKLVASELSLETHPSAEVVIAGATLTNTPIHCQISDRPLRLIVSKGNHTA